MIFDSSKMTYFVKRLSIGKKNEKHSSRLCTYFLWTIKKEHGTTIIMTEASEASDDSNLSEFTLSIRSVVRFCNQKYQNLSTEGEKDKPKLPIEISAKVCHCVNEFKTRRQRAYDKFWGTVDDKFELKAIHVDKTTSPQDFRKNFHNPNLPCLIDFQEDEDSPFRYVNKHWRKAANTTTQKVGGKRLPILSAILRHEHLLWAATAEPARFRSRWW